jgi:hypothetical protein
MVLTTCLWESVHTIRQENPPGRLGMTLMRYCWHKLTLFLAGLPLDNVPRLFDNYAISFIYSASSKGQWKGKGT